MHINLLILFIFSPNRLLGFVVVSMYNRHLDQLCCNACLSSYCPFPIRAYVGISRDCEWLWTVNRLRIRFESEFRCAHMHVCMAMCLPIHLLPKSLATASVHGPWIYNHVDSHLFFDFSRDTCYSISDASKKTSCFQQQVDYAQYNLVKRLNIRLPISHTKLHMQHINKIFISFWQFTELWQGGDLR